MWSFFKIIFDLYSCGYTSEIRYFIFKVIKFIVCGNIYRFCSNTFQKSWDRKGEEPVYWPVYWCVTLLSTNKPLNLFKDTTICLPTKWCENQTHIFDRIVVPRKVGCFLHKWIDFNEKLVGGRHGWASWRGYESHKSTQNENFIGKTILQLSTTFGAVWSSS